MTIPFADAFMPEVPEASSGRRGLLSQTSTPRTMQLGDPHVVVLEDEDAAAELRRAAAGEDRLDHLLAGPVGRVGLAGEDELDRPVGVVDEAGEPVHVGEEERGPLVGGEAAGEADRQDLRIERPARAR